MNVGIDLGTTYSAVAYFDKERGEAVILPNSEGEKTTPSVTRVHGGKVTIGNAAKAAMGAGDCDCAAFYKNMMGEDYRFYLDGGEYSAEDLSAMFLKELIKDIEGANGVKIDGAVITCPAYFDETRRTATLNAGKRAGLNVLKIINEPTSAIIAYGLTGGKKKTAMVYDLGGGTFDVTIAQIDGARIDVVTTNGDHSLGGKDWDNVLFGYFAEQFLSEFGVDINGSPEDCNELKVACEEAKKKLTSIKEVSVTVRSGGYTGRYAITAEEFEKRTQSLLNQTETIIEKCFGELSARRPFGWGDLDEVVLVGGSTRMPQVKKLIAQRFAKPPVTANVNVDTIVAAGAAIQAELCTAQTLTLGGTVSKRAYGIGGTAPRIGGLTISGKDIRDITAHSLGMLAYKKEGGSIINSIILKKNSKIGVAVTKNYSFAGRELDAYVLQGESEDPYQSNLLYHYLITGMPEGRKNDIDVSFLYNQNGIVEVTAATKQGQKLTVSKQPVTETLDEIIVRLLKEADKKSAAKTVQVLMIVDVSGSMGGKCITEAKCAMRAFASAVDGGIELGIVKFADGSDYQLNFTSDRRRIERSIDSIDVDGQLGYGTEGNDLFSSYERDFDRNAERIVIVLTDGAWSNAAIAVRQAAHMKDSGITIYAVGVEGANYRFLEKIASPGCARKVEPSELTQAFGDIANRIATEN